MSATKNNQNQNPNKTTNTSTEQLTDVLYQKLGEHWFAFSLIDDDVFMAPITESQINEIRNENH